MTESRWPGALAYRGFRRLALALALSSFGDWLGFLATTALATQLVEGFDTQSFAVGGVLAFRLLPSVLLAPLWSEEARAAPGRWYRRAGLAILGGLAIFACWLVPAAIQGDAAYREALLWKQTAGRLENAFAHQRPWWWYLPLIPLVLFPWSLWPPLWPDSVAASIWRPGRYFTLLTACLPWQLASRSSCGSPRAGNRRGTRGGATGRRRGA